MYRIAKHDIIKMEHWEDIILNRTLLLVVSLKEEDNKKRGIHGWLCLVDLFRCCNTMQSDTNGLVVKINTTLSKQEGNQLRANKW